MADRRKTPVIDRDDQSEEEAIEDKTVDEEEDDTNGSSNSSEEEEEQDEPKLRYDRITSDLAKIFVKDAASCLAAHSKFLALGTHWGIVHVLDLQGTKIQDKEFQSHTTTVNQISIDANGDYIASCSDDGVVSINGLYTSEFNTKSCHDFPVRSVALDPLFGRKRDRQYVLGGADQLILYEKGFFRNKSTVIHAGEGPVRVIKWRGNFIAWANDFGVKLYDCSSRTRISYVSREENAPRPDVYQCDLCWKNGTTLFIGWGKSVRICCIKERPQNDIRDLPRKYVEITQHFQVDFFIAGIAPLKGDIAVLSYIESSAEEGTRGQTQRPQLRIIAQSKDGPQEVAADALSIRGFEEYRCNDYHLEYIEGENLMLVVSPKDVVVAKPRDLDDHLDFLIEREKYEEALMEAELSAKQLFRHTPEEIGHRYLKVLIANDDYGKAASLCEKVLGTNKDKWESTIYLFKEKKQLKAIAPYIPRRRVCLSKTVYEMVLNEFLNQHPGQFLQLLKDWPCNLYNINAIETVVQNKLRMDPDDKLLHEAQALLHIYSQQFDKALNTYLRLGHEDVFKLIDNHDLFSSIQENVVMLMDLHPTRTVDMLLSNMDKIPVRDVVEQLKERPRLKHTYLDAVFTKNPRFTEDFHADQVELYAEYDHTGLLHFLRSSNSYPLEKALKICEQRQLHEEQVYLLGRMGNLKDALKLIIEKLGRVEKAIDFAKEHNDEELWKDLIAYSVDKAPFITGLLCSIGTQINPQGLIKRISPRMVIPGLRQALIKVLHDYNLELSLREGFKKILVSDSASLMDRLNKTQRQGTYVSARTVCRACQGPVLFMDSRRGRNLVVFYNKTVYHEECLPSVDEMHPPVQRTPTTRRH